MHILSLQPYYGGSHRAFQTGWQNLSCHQWTILSLPPRHWKWRMRHAAVEFARRLKKEFEDTPFDAVFCSDFLNLAEFKGLVSPSISQLPVVVYFHENQFAYPSRRYDERDLHFGFTNFTSCLAADQVWFNSEFNRDSFLDGLKLACQKWPDFPPREAIDSIPPKCSIQSPGIEVPDRLAARAPAGPGQPLRIVWAARWEHDKNPALLLETLQRLQEQNTEFRLSVIGESFRRIPGEFHQIQQQFSDRIDRWGYQESRADYWQTLAEADVFVSTADHEFFGIAAAEAIVAGTLPLLPHRLAYPELIGAHRDPARAHLFLYDGTSRDLALKLEYVWQRQSTNEARRLTSQLQSELAKKLSWERRAPQLDELLEPLACLTP